MFSVIKHLHKSDVYHTEIVENSIQRACEIHKALPILILLKPQEVQ